MLTPVSKRMGMYDKHRSSLCSPSAPLPPHTMQKSSRTTSKQVSKRKAKQEGWANIQELSDQQVSTVTTDRATRLSNKQILCFLVQVWLPLRIKTTLGLRLHLHHLHLLVFHHLVLTAILLPKLILQHLFQGLYSENHILRVRYVWGQWDGRVNGCLSWCWRSPKTDCWPVTYFYSWCTECYRKKAKENAVNYNYDHLLSGHIAPSVLPRTDGFCRLGGHGRTITKHTWQRRTNSLTKAASTTHLHSVWHTLIWERVCARKFAQSFLLLFSVNGSQCCWNLTTWFKLLCKLADHQVLFAASFTL